MGNVVSAASVPATTIDNYVGELVDVQYERRLAIAGYKSRFGISIPENAFSDFYLSLGSTRLFKTIKCRHREGSLVVKVFVKPIPGLSLSDFLEELRRSHHNVSSKNISGARSKPVLRFDYQANEGFWSPYRTFCLRSG